MTLLQGDAGLRKAYQTLFGTPAADTTLLVNTAKALAAYQATLSTPRTTFDQFRHELLHSNTAAAKTATARYPLAAQRGLKIFVGKGRCFFCHTGPAFSNGEFADIGRPFFTAAGADPGRWGGLQQLLASPYTRVGVYADASGGEANDTAATSTRHVLMEPRHYGEFKVPSLRGLTRTAPYFHDGSAATLHEVVGHYSSLDTNRLHADGALVLQALRLTPQEVADMVAFLKTLSAPAKP
jgi:cytochrome c peroxidase